MGSLITTACTLVAVLIPFVVLDPSQMLVLALLVAALLPWAVLYLRPAWGPLKFVLAGALTAVLTVSAAGTLYYRAHPVQENDVKASAPPSLAKLASRLKFLPLPGPVDHCVSFAGTGTIPAHYALVLFDRPSDSAGHYSPTSTFSYDGPAGSTPGAPGWTAPDRNIGSGDASDQNGHITIAAVLVPQDTVTFLDAFTSDSDSGQLPPAVTALGATADQLTLTRNTRNARC